MVDSTSQQFQTLHWVGQTDGYLHLIDQTLLPDQEQERILDHPEQVIEAIQQLAVRGAPAIGVAAAYGLCLAIRNSHEIHIVRSQFQAAVPAMRNARPTAVNLQHMVDRMARVEQSDQCAQLDGPDLKKRLLQEARNIHEEDQNFCRGIGESGAPLIKTGSTILTHCNAGALATAGAGTALSVLYEAWRQGKRFHVLADETRPLLQGSRLTAWELQKNGIPVDVICDGAAGSFFQNGDIDLVITGSDRVAANGDAANKIGTYTIATLARAHQIPFYIAAPSSTFDLSIESGTQIPIEQRSETEIWEPAASSRPPQGIGYRNPAFDVTPASHIAGWITEVGILQPPFDQLRP
ncbi:MAG: S-methyl-5-thioribose-1-phosphate isomerase [Planctomycetota bacterium]